MDGILRTYSYFYNIINIAIQRVKYPDAPYKEQIHTIDWDLIGSRLSAKTVQVLRFLIEAGIIGKQEMVNIATTIIRLEPKGAVETYDELLGVAEDIYELPVNRATANISKRTYKVGSNSIRAIGILSNRKKKTPKLGMARKGIKKDIQITMLEETTEFTSEKTVSLIKQSLGGATFNINIRIANPWVLSMWYVKSVNKFLPFNRAALEKNGEQFKQKYYAKKKKLRIVHITNHRVNTFLSEAQHQELKDIKDIDETLWLVADLGMPGVAEGLIYAPIMKHIQPPTRNQPTQEYRAGLDWGTSTGINGSATALVMGRIGISFKTITIDDEYYHSNATQSYKDDTILVKELMDKLILYYIDNRQGIQNCGGFITIYYDYAAHALGGLLEAEKRIRKEHKAIVQKLDFKPCYKFNVPVRIDIVKSIISQGRYKCDVKTTPHHWEELEGCMWDDSREVKGRPTRLNEDDHTLDASEYMIGADLYNFADTRYLAHNKLI